MNNECPATFPATLVTPAGRTRLIVEFDRTAGLSLRRVDAQSLLVDRSPVRGRTILGSFVERRSSPWLAFFPSVRVPGGFLVDVV